MPRHNRRAVPTPLSRAGIGAERREDWRGELYVVRTVPAQNAVKAYRCPGCDQLVAAGVAHVVAWPASDPDAGERRHWHASCWAARERRAPTHR